MARKALLNQRNSKRKNSFWKGSRQHVNIVIFSYVSGKVNSFNKLWRLIEDPIVRIEVLTRLDRLTQLPTELTGELHWLRETYGVNSFSYSDLDQSIEIMGIRISRANENEDVVLLLRLLMESPAGMNKETICKNVWNLQYDPVIHDGKIYKLILKARKASGRKDLIINKYGKYLVARRA
jgi:hypothetical protein